MVLRSPSCRMAEDVFIFEVDIRLMLKTLVPAMTSGTLAALLSFFSTLPLVVAALAMVGGTSSSLTSAITASCAGIALIGGYLAWRWRMPIFISWSVPGAALLAGLKAIPHFELAMGGFVASALLVMSIAANSRLIHWVERLPASLCAALLAGLLFPFTLGMVQAIDQSMLFGGLGLAAYLVGRRVAPSYAMVFVFLAMALALALFSAQTSVVTHDLAAGLVWQMPKFSLGALISVGLPLCVVSLVAQNLPGLALLRQQGHQPNVRKVLWCTGATSLLLAPFGVFGLNLAPISAAMCSGTEGEGAGAHRLTASFAYAATYALLALYSAPLLALFNMLPRPAILAMTGCALLLPLGRSLERMLFEERCKEAAVMTFLTSASGLTLLGVGSSFWALVVGLIALCVI